MNQVHLVTILPKNRCDGCCVINIPSDDEAGGIRMVTPDPSQFPLGLQQHLLADAAAVSQSDCASQVSSSPAFPLLLGQRRNLPVRLAFLAVLHPAILKAELQRADITCRDQFPRFNAEVGLDLFHHLTVLDRTDAAGCAKAQVVRSKRGSCQSQAQGDVLREVQEGLPPNSRRGVIGIHTKVMRFVSDGQHTLGRPGPQG